MYYIKVSKKKTTGTFQCPEKGHYYDHPINAHIDKNIIVPSDNNTIALDQHVGRKIIVHIDRSIRKQFY